MIHRVIRSGTRIAVVITLHLLVCVYARAQSPEPSKPPSAVENMSVQQRESIEKIVRDYLIKNPEVIREAMKELEAREEKEKRERVVRSLAELKQEIYGDSDSPVVGNPKGDVTIVVFFDYNCGYCKRSLPELEAFIEKDTMVKVIYKEFPILGNHSLIAATAALAAKRQGAYAAFSHALFASDGAGEPILKGLADHLKLNFTRLQQDMADPKLMAEIERNLKLAEALEINGTPAYIIGNQIVPGAIDIGSLKVLVASERGKAAGAKPAVDAAPTRK